MSGVREKIAWGLVVALGLAVIASFAGIVRGGPLDPTGSPAPTMKTLDVIPPAWSQYLTPAAGCTSQRFTCVLSGAAVLDKETGLVWDKSPDADLDWPGAVYACRGAIIGGRKGWRLPTFIELQTLIEPTLSPRIPAGVFSGVLTLSTDNYWTATSWIDDPTYAWTIRFYDGNAQAKLKVDVPPAPAGRHAWCVRAPDSGDPF